MLIHTSNGFKSGRCNVHRHTKNLVNNEPHFSASDTNCRGWTIYMYPLNLINYIGLFVFSYWVSTFQYMTVWMKYEDHFYLLLLVRMTIQIHQHWSPIPIYIGTWHDLLWYISYLFVFQVRKWCHKYSCKTRHILCGIKPWRSIIQSFPQTNKKYIQILIGHINSPM